MRVVERPFSEFLRHPNDVVAELAEHDVMLRRRNAPALWLTRADRHTDRREAFEATARAAAQPCGPQPWGLGRGAGGGLRLGGVPAQRRPQPLR